MRLLLDTHIAVWAAINPDALSNAERQWMREADAPLMLSAVSVWELRLKWHSFQISGARKGPVGPQSVVDFAIAMAWGLLPLTVHHAATALAQTLNHKDPFDELLLVLAQIKGLRFLTRDAKLAGHPLAVAEGSALLAGSRQL